MHKNLRFSIITVLLITLVSLILIELSLRIFGQFYLSSKKDKTHHPEKINILCLGESTTNLPGLPSYPSILQDLLDEKYPKKFNVINRGRPAALTSYFVHHIDNILAVTNPDLSILMLGINDALLDKKNENKLKVTFYQELLNQSYLYRYINNYHKLNAFEPVDSNVYSFEDTLAIVAEKSNSSSSTSRLIKTWQSNSPEQIKSFLEDNLNEYPYSFVFHLAVFSMFLSPDQEIFEIINQHRSIAPERISLLSMIVFGNALSKYPEIKSKIILDQCNYLLSVASDKEQTKNLCLQSILSYLRQTKGLTAAVYPDIWNKYQRNKEQMILGDEFNSEMIALLDKFLSHHFSKTKFNTPPPQLWKKSKTIDNLNYIRKKIGSSGSKVVFMQYPLRSVESIKKQFPKDPVISNISNFKKALSIHPREKIFIDMFGHDFGHTSQLGSELLAFATFDYIQKLYFKESL